MAEVGRYCPCCFRSHLDGCAPGCVVGLPATPKQHDEVESYATKHGLSFEEAHVEVSVLAGRKS